VRIFFGAFLLIALACPAPGFAQFQAPTDEELKMTADPKAPGADAVFLNLEQVTDNMASYESIHATSNRLF
jgi:hypothetical protein